MPWGGDRKPLPSTSLFQMLLEAIHTVNQRQTDDRQTHTHTLIPHKRQSNVLLGNAAEKSTGIHDTSLSIFL